MWVYPQKMYWKEVEKWRDKNTTITLIKHAKNLPNNLSILSSHFQIKIYNAKSSKTEKVSDKRKRKRSFYTTVWKECKSDEIIPEMKCVNQIKESIFNKIRTNQTQQIFLLVFLVLLNDILTLVIELTY